MYNFLVNKGQTAALILGVVVVAIFMITVFTGLNGAGYDMSTDLNGLDDQAKNAISFFNPGLGLTILLAAAAFILAFIVFGVINVMKFPKESTRALMAVAGLAVIFAIFYFTANTSFGEASKMSELIQKNGLSDNVVKFISGGINVTILLSLAAFAIMVIFEVKNAFN